VVAQCAFAFMIRCSGCPRLLVVGPLVIGDPGDKVSIVLVLSRGERAYLRLFFSFLCFLVLLT
jgi:hypothetical protein